MRKVIVLLMLAALLSLGACSFGEANEGTDQDSSENISNPESPEAQEDQSGTGSETQEGHSGSGESATQREGQEDMIGTDLDVTLADRTFKARLYDHESTHAFIALLPLTVTMNDLNANEKYFYLENELPSNPESVNKIQAGDLNLFGDDCLVLFYEDFNT